MSTKKQQRQRRGISADLRRAIERSGLTRGAIAKLAGMPRSQLTRIASGGTEPILGSAERIAKAIGLRIVLAKAKGRKVAR